MHTSLFNKKLVEHEIYKYNQEEVLLQKDRSMCYKYTYRTQKGLQ